MIKLINDFVSKQGISFDYFYKMAEWEDNEYIRDKIFELLPEGWEKAEEDKKPRPLSSFMKKD
jgi:hypothetical protein